MRRNPETKMSQWSERKKESENAAKKRDGVVVYSVKKEKAKSGVNPFLQVNEALGMLLG